MDLNFLFLPPIYLVTLFVAAVITGLTFDYINQRPILLASAVLFSIFTVGQLVYRFLENEMPERLVGQWIYYLLFLGTIFLTREVKARMDDR